FLVGLMVLAAAVLGSPWPARPGRHEPAPEPPRPATSWAVLGACCAACLINPSGVRIYQAAGSSFAELLPWSPGTLTQDQVSLFGPASRRLFFQVTTPEGLAFYRLVLTYYIAIVGVGLASFVL